MLSVVEEKLFRMHVEERACGLFFNIRSAFSWRDVKNHEKH
jgi:hypothetical protein